ncbi:MAG: AAA family ATPase [Gallionella sp.]|jgi:hypothetical protein
MAIDIKKEMSDIRAMYDSQTQQRSFNALVYSDFGCGKTQLAETCRLPVHTDSFDPGGTKTIRDAIKEGKILADTRYEVEDPMKPTAFELWDKEYHRRKREGYFDYIGTYFLDSATTWSSAAMNVILKKANRLGGPPFQQDYLPAMSMIENAIKDMTTLPCDVILTAHLDVDKDEATGRMFVGPLFVGKLKQRIPLLFDELYCAQTKNTSAGVVYSLLTRSDGIFKARTRLGKGGIFETNETPNIKALLKKAGYPIEDKPY